MYETNIKDTFHKAILYIVWGRQDTFILLLFSNAHQGCIKYIHNFQDYLYY